MQAGESAVPTCRDMSELVTDYLEQALPTRTWFGVRVHLLLCSACRTYFSQMRETVGLLARLPRQQPAPEAEAGLLARLPPEDGQSPG